MDTLRTIILAGSPNVGKSATFNFFTGQYAMVSNYPGTTVEVMRGSARIGKEDFSVVDTPGLYSLVSVSEEERVARSIIMSEHPACILHIVDAKNLQRMLPLTLQLLEAGLPVILVLNMMDEARERGICIDIERLEKELGVPVCATVSTTGEGMDILKGKIESYVRGRTS